MTAQVQPTLHLWVWVYSQAGCTQRRVHSSRLRIQMLPDRNTGKQQLKGSALVEVYACYFSHNLLRSFAVCCAVLCCQGC